MQMKRQVLFVQGGGERVHDDWDRKLVESLGAALGPNYEIRYPRMPNEDDPSYATWKATLAKEFAALNDGAILVGHSLERSACSRDLMGKPRTHKGPTRMARNPKMTPDIPFNRTH